MCELATSIDRSEIRSVCNPLETEIDRIYKITVGIVMASELIATKSFNSVAFDRPKLEYATGDSVFALYSSIAILTAMAVSTYAFVARERQKSDARKSLEKSPCDRCEYFNRNLYLNCAIHPTIVKTEAANDCIDYCPDSRTKRAEELKKSLPFTSKIFPNRSNLK